MYTTARADKAVNINFPSVTLVPSLSLADDGPVPVPVPKDSFFVVSSQHVAPSSLLVQGSALQFVSIGIPLSSLITFNLLCFVVAQTQTRVYWPITHCMNTSGRVQMDPIHVGSEVKALCQTIFLFCWILVLLPTAVALVCGRVAFSIIHTSAGCTMRAKAPSAFARIRRSALPLLAMLPTVSSSASAGRPTLIASSGAW